MHSVHSGSLNAGTVQGVAEHASSHELALLGARMQGWAILQRISGVGCIRTSPAAVHGASGVSHRRVHVSTCACHVQHGDQVFFVLGCVSRSWQASVHAHA